MALKITILQTDPQWEAVERNLDAATRQILTAKGDLVVLPEMFATGFSMSPQNCSMPSEKAEKWFGDIATKSNKAVCGSLVVSHDKDFYNRLYFAKPSGEVVHYDKRHLFRIDGEHEHYKNGSERVVVEYGGFRILLAICYDLRFPVWLRNRGDYDLMINVASWDKARQGVWRTLLRARAIENQCYVVGVNRVGSDPLSQYGGSSAIIDYYGEPIFEDTSARECNFTAEISKESLDLFRTKFPAHLDADKFEIKIG